MVAQGRPRRGRVETEPRLPSQEPTRGVTRRCARHPGRSQQFFPMWATKSPGRPVPVMLRNGFIFGGTRQRRGSAWRGAFTQTRFTEGWRRVRSDCLQLENNPWPRFDVLAWNLFCPLASESKGNNLL